MSHRLSLSKLTGKQGPQPAQPLMSFRYNPGDEDIEELQPQQLRLSSDQKGTHSREPSVERSSKASEDKPDSSSAVPGRAQSDKASVRSDVHGGTEGKRRSPETVLPEQEDIKEASPVKDYLSKFGKKPSSVDSNVPPVQAASDATTDSWFSGLRERLAKRIEEKIQNSKVRKDEESTRFKEEEGKQTSDDEKARSRCVTPAEEAQEALEGAVVPPSEESIGSTARQRHPPQKSESPCRTPQASLADEPTIVTNDGADPELDNWEFVERAERPHTLPTRSKESSTAEPAVPVLDQSNILPIKEYLVSNAPLVAMACAIVALVIPLPQFLSGFVVGGVLSMLGFSFAWYLLVPTEPRVQFEVPDYKHMPPLRVPRAVSVAGDGGRSDIMATYEVWMSQLPFSVEYNVETHHMNNTQSVNLVLCGSSLRLRWPKANVPRRAMWNEKRPDPIFVDQRHYIITHAKLVLLPEKLSEQRIWNRKYPICLIIPTEEHYLEQSKELAGFQPQTGAADATPEEDVAAGKKAPPAHDVLYLFARTCRDKEEWFRRFQHAIASSSASKVKKAQFGDTLSTNVSYEVYMSELFLRHQEEQRVSPKVSSSRHSFLVSAAPPGAPSSSSCFRATLQPTSLQTYQSDTQWINVLIGRIFHDFLTHREWADVVRDRIQKKLSKIKVPFFMEELMVTDINLGTQLPYIRRTSEAVSDERGVWVDLDVTYNGAFYMTLTTKLNLMRLKRSQTEEMQSITHDNTDEESAVSSDEEDPDRAESSYISKDPSSASAGTGKKILDLVDKIAQSKYFQQATENRYIKRKMEEMSNTPLVLTVEITHLVGTLALNVPPPPTDRIWYGFRTLPKMQLVARPKLGEKEVTIARVTERIEKMLFLEFQRLLVMPNMDDFVIPIMHSELC